MKMKDSTLALIFIIVLGGMLFVSMFQVLKYEDAKKSGDNIVSTSNSDSFDTSKVINMSYMFKDVEFIHPDVNKDNEKAIDEISATKQELTFQKSFYNFISFICIFFTITLLLVIKSQLFPEKKTKEKEVNIKELIYETKDRLMFIDNLLATKKYSISDISKSEIDDFPLSSCVQMTDMLQIFELLNQLDEKYNAEENSEIASEDYQSIHKIYEKVLAKNKKITDRLIELRDREHFQRFFAIADEISKSISD